MVTPEPAGAGAWAGAVKPALRRALAEDWPFLKQQLENLLLPGFAELPVAVKQAIVGSMYEMEVAAGTILIQQVRGSKGMQKVSKPV